jgi:hypothetical protein
VKGVVEGRSTSHREGRRAFNHLVGAQKERLLDREAVRLRRTDVRQPDAPRRLVRPGNRELMRADHLGNGPIVRGRIRGVVAYSAKLGRRRDVIDEDDLFIVLPPSRRSGRRRCPLL